MQLKFSKRIRRQRVSAIFENQEGPGVNTAAAVMAAFAVEPQAPTLGSEPMMLGSPTSPKPGVNAQFLPGFLMGD